MNLLENKIALDTGGRRGIGAGSVKALVAQRANVCFHYRSSADQAEVLIHEMDAGEHQIRAYQPDASDITADEEVVKQVLEDFGTIDILVNNAGITQDNLLLKKS